LPCWVEGVVSRVGGGRGRGRNEEGTRAGRVRKQGEYFEKLGHGSSLLFGYRSVFLLDHTEAGDGELELDFYLGLLRASILVLKAWDGLEGVGTTTVDEGAIVKKTTGSGA